MSLPSLVRFARELKARKVLRVAGVYAVVGFVVVQVADIVFPALHLPTWTVTLVVALSLLGFPVALVLAWAYDLTPDGVVRAGAAEGPLDPASDPDRGGGRSLALGLGVLVALVGFGAYALVTWGNDDDSGPAALRSVAVLPFENLSTDPENAFFAAGVHDEVLTHLGRVGELRVISRTSVLPYAGTGKGVRQIGQELGVGALVEGSVQRYGDQIRVTAQLIDAATDEQLWSDRYDRRLDDIFSIQTEIALAITRALEARLTPEEQRRVEGVPTANLEAYRLYVQGRGLWDQRTPDAMRGSVEYFLGAIEQDSSYAPAWAGLADALSTMQFYGVPSGIDMTAADAVEHALALGPNLAEAHVSRAITLQQRKEGPAAIHALERAIELQPSYAEAHLWLGWLRLVLGDPVSGLTNLEEAERLNPLAPAVRAYLAEGLLANERPEEALAEARRARSLQPAYGLAYYVEALVLYHLGRHDESAAVLRTAVPLVLTGGSPEPPEVWALLALNHAARDDLRNARARLDRIREAGHPFSEGLVLAALGDVDGAFDAFRRVPRWYTFSTEHLRYFFPEVLGRVRTDPRYPALHAEVERRWGVRSAAGLSAR